jgi:N-acetylmuramoyl-L-alanine amidase
MPGILIELGFITNLNDLKVLNDKKNHDKFAQGIFKAFEGFKNQYEKGMENSKAADTAAKQTNVFDTAKIKNAAPNANDGEHYRVQILAVSKVLNKNAPDLKGNSDARYIKAGNLYKYTIGEYTTIDLAKKALGEIRKSFPQAFVIKVRNNTIVPINN